MKLKTLFLLALLSCSLHSCYKEDTESLEKVFYKYHGFIDAKNFDKAFDFFHPTFLGFIPKAALMKEAEGLSDNEYFSYHIDNVKLTSISNIIEEDGIEYAFFVYEANTYIKFNKSANQEMINAMKEQAEKRFLNVNYSESKRELSHLKITETIAIKDNSWKFVPYNKKMTPLFIRFIPKTVLEKLVPEKED